MQDSSESTRFDGVMETELELLAELRGDGSVPAMPSDTDQSVYARAHATGLAGLAFSGGGIRSATFNLGVILALAKHGLLHRFDYLSTVSGGGYIGGWLSALLHRHASRDGRTDRQAVSDFEPALTTHPSRSGMPQPDTTAGFAPVEHAAVRFLRRYSHYLAPRHGLSGDLLAAISLFLRNLVLLQIALIALLTAVLMTGHIVGLWSARADQGVPWLLGWLDALGSPLGWAWPFTGATLALVIALVSAGRLLAAAGSQVGKARQAASEVLLWVALPGLIAGWWFSMGLKIWSSQLQLTQIGITAQIAAWLNRITDGALGPAGQEGLLWVSIGTVGYLVAWLLGFGSAVYFRRLRRGKPGGMPDPRRLHTLALPAAFAGGVFGLLLYLATRVVASEGENLSMWVTVAFGTPIFMHLFSLVIAVHVGVARRQFSEQDREWWARLGGMVLFMSGGWVLVFCLVIYAPPLMTWLATGGLAATGAWAISSGAGAWLARGSQPATPRHDGWQNIVAKAAPWIFVTGLGVLVAYGAHATLMAMFEPQTATLPSGSPFPAIVDHELRRLDSLGNALGKITLTWIGTWIFFGLFTWRFDINLFSLHTLYRNRLERAYLGASKVGKRKPNPFTGFDPADDLRFDQLARQRPIHIINTTVNMTGGDDLAWQTRRGAAFAFTPTWAGFDAKGSQGDDIGCFRPTSQFAGGFSLATLMAVSGAAASPNMGYHTSAAVAALLTALNLRLGRWCGNPVREDVWRLHSPTFSAGPILADLSGSANARAKWINLTDGGHFENLGIYELVRRRCRLIVVSDAGCDPEHHFEDLANSIRKCWTDFGVDIHFDSLDELRKVSGTGYCAARHVVGRIRYPDHDEDGLILYLKAALTGEEPVDIREYADNHSTFPHQSTGDQFFDEDQFEGYRHLGFDVAAEVAAALTLAWPDNGETPDYPSWNSTAQTAAVADAPCDPSTSNDAPHRRG